MVNIHELNEDETPKCFDSCGGDHNRVRRMLLLDRNHEEGGEILGWKVGLLSQELNFFDML